MNKKVIIGLNGSPDSLTAAYLLKKQKYQVSAIGVSFAHAEDQKEGSYPNIYPNYEINNVSEIQNHCKKLDIPFQLVDASEQCKTEIINSLITSRLKGIQFDVSFEITRLLIKILFEKMIALKGNLIATGHFAKVVHSVADNQFFLKSTEPIEEDQSHLLSRVSKFHMTKLYLPFAEMRKSEVRKIFSQNFSTSPRISKSEISSIDFGPHIPNKMIKDIDIINYSEDTTVGTVKGIHHIELGQNKVQDETGNIIYSDKNSIIAKVMPEKSCAYVVKNKDLSFDACYVSKFSVLSSIDQTRPMNIFVKFKNTNTRYPALLIFRNNGHALVRFKEALTIQALAGQNVVFYDNLKSKSLLLGCAEINQKGILKGRHIKELPIQSFDLNKEENNEDSSFTF